ALVPPVGKPARRRDGGSGTADRLAGGGGAAGVVPAGAAGAPRNAGSGRARRARRRPRQSERNPALPLPPARPAPAARDGLHPRVVLAELPRGLVPPVRTPPAGHVRGGCVLRPAAPRRPGDPH